MEAEMNDVTVVLVVKTALIARYGQGFIVLRAALSDLICMMSVRLLYKLIAVVVITDNCYYLI